MLVIKATLALERALASPIDAELCRILTLRRDQLSESGHYVGGYAHFIVVGSGDRLAEIETAAGFPIATNIVDQIPYGQPDFEPSWEGIDRHPGGIFELVFVLDDQLATVVLIPDDPGIDPTLLRLCREFAM